MFCYGMIPTMSKPTRVTANTANAIDHVITYAIINTDLKTGILKICISFCYHASLSDRWEKKCVTSHSNILNEAFRRKFLMKI